MTKKKNKQKTKKHFFLILKLLLVFLFVFTLPGISVYQIPAVGSVPVDLTFLPTPAPYPENLNYYPVPSISASAVYVLDLNSQIVLFEKNPRVRFSPASTTKILTAIVALENFDPEQILEVKTVITEGRVMNLYQGEKISAENLILGALIHSANDAAFTLAENYPGGVEAFVDKMNEKVKELNLTDTHINNPIGFEDENHYTSAYDLAQISRLALQNLKIKKIIATKIISVSDATYSTFHTLENVNSLLGEIPGVAGIKTGWTENAGEVLVTLVKRQDKEVLVVLLKSKDRFGETATLIKWIFDNFAWVDLRPT